MLVRRRNKKEMSLLKKLFARKALDGLLQISDRIYVLNCCLSTEILGEEQHRENLSTIITQLKNFYSDSSFMVLNFLHNRTRSKSLDAFSHFGITIIDYPSKFQKCPLISLNLIVQILKSSLRWLKSFDKTSNNILLLHCENGAWPFLSFILASFLVLNKEAYCENKTLEMVYKRISKDLLQSRLELNPQPSHLRYLQYVDKLRTSLGFRESQFILECLILRNIPNFDGERGCRPVLRVYGTDPSMRHDGTSTIIFTTYMTKKKIKYYKQGENNAVIKLNADCQIHGDVVVECIHVAKDDSSREDIMFSFMFNTGFVQSNMVIFTRDELDITWNNGKDKFQEDFKIEVFFSDPIYFEPIHSEPETSTKDQPCTQTEEIESVSTEIPDEFFDSEEIIRETNNPINSKPKPKCPLEIPEEDSYTHFDIHVVERTSNSEPEIKLELNNETVRDQLPDILVIEHKICVNEGEKSNRIMKNSPKRSLLPPKTPPQIRVIKNLKKQETIDQPKPNIPKSKITIIPKKSTTPRTNVESKVAKLIYGDKNISNKPPKSPKTSFRSVSFSSPITIMSPTRSISNNYTQFNKRSSLGSPNTGPLPHVKTRVVETKPPNSPREILNTNNKAASKSFNSSLTRSLSSLSERYISTSLSPRVVPKTKLGTSTGTGMSSGTKISSLNRDSLKRSSSVSSSRSVSAPKMSSSRLTRSGI